MGYYTGKRILVIGGTGTIGNGLIKELIKQDPEVIRIYSRDEYKQFVMENHLNDEKLFRFLIGDVRDYERLNRAMQGIDIVYNLAAMKHVASCEYNPDEAIKTNVLGMQNVINAAIENNVETVLFTSSDKAINPSNTYGATKLLAERLVQAANFSKGNARTKFVVVRFGNVIGSRGSVIPLFKEQILSMRKITITDPNMTRFMMSLAQAVELILTAAEIAIGGEVFILKMPVLRLMDVADIIIKDVCEKQSLKEDIKIEIIGLKAGERRFEELMTKDESENAFDIDGMYVVVPPYYYSDLSKYYENQKKAYAQSYNSTDIEPVSVEIAKELII